MHEPMRKGTDSAAGSGRKGRRKSTVRPPPKQLMALSYSLFEPLLTMAFHVACRSAAQSMTAMIYAGMGRPRFLILYASSTSRERKRQVQGGRYGVECVGAGQETGELCRASGVGYPDCRASGSIAIAGDFPKLFSRKQIAGHSADSQLRLSRRQDGRLEESGTRHGGFS